MLRDEDCRLDIFRACELFIIMAGRSGRREDFDDKFSRILALTPICMTIGGTQGYSDVVTIHLEAHNTLQESSGFMARVEEAARQSREIATELFTLFGAITGAMKGFRQEATPAQLDLMEKIRYAIKIEPGTAHLAFQDGFNKGLGMINYSHELSNLMNQS